MSKAENMNEKLISYEVWKESIKQQNYCSYFQSKFWRVGRVPKIFLLFSKAAVKNQTCSRTTSTTPRILSLLQKKEIHWPKKGLLVVIIKNQLRNAWLLRIPYAALYRKVVSSNLLMSWKWCFSEVQGWNLILFVPCETLMHFKNSFLEVV